MPRHRWRKWGRALASLLVALPIASHFAWADPAHYFVVKEGIDGSLSVVSHDIVTVSGALKSESQPVLASRLETRVSATVQDKITGAVVFTGTASTSPWLRGEFHGSGQIDGYVFPLDERVYVVRVPIVAGSLLRLQGSRVPTKQSGQPQGTGADSVSTSTLDIDLDAYPVLALAEKTPGVPGQILVAPLPPGYSTGSLAQNGNPANRLDLLVVSEGYTSAQQTQFIQQATALADTFLSIPPYSDFRHLINVTWLFVPSNQSGADKPTCAETPGSTVIAVDTAFDATFCASSIRRLVTVSTSKVLTAAANVPDWDKILVLVNDSEYGGSGGSIGVATTHALSPEIMQHEFGHSFTSLADEYSSAYPGYPACSDLSGTRPCEPNVSDQTNRSLLKWSGWISASTPIPSSGALADPIAAGLWLGARYLSVGMYRQCYNGIMRALGNPFCNVDREAFVKRLYAGGWGVPSQGVRLIEPGAVPATSSFSAPAASNVLFQASLAGSLAAGGLTATWLVDGSVKKVDASTHGAQVSFTYAVPDVLLHSVELRVSDSTPLVLITPVTSQIWSVQGLPAVSCSYSLASASASFSFSVASGNVTVLATPTCNWTAVSNASWITVTSGASSVGNGSAGYSLAANTAASARTGTITIAGLTFTISQGAAPFPGAPIIGRAAPGNGQAFIFFSPPADAGGSPISNYTATCSPAGATGSGLISPIVVGGLPNDITQSCSVTATNDTGTGPASATVNVTPSASTSLALLAVASRKTHGTLGAFDLPIDISQSITQLVTVEPRVIGSGHTIVFQFNATISAAGTVTVVPVGTATAAVAGNEVLVTLNNIPDSQRVTVSLANVNGVLNPAPVSLGFLVGDASSSRSTSALDTSGVKNRSGQITSGINFRFDLNASGSINAADINVSKARSGHPLP